MATIERPTPTETMETDTPAIWLELAERCEQSNGAHRDLDRDVVSALAGRRATGPMFAEQAYTSSLEAAIRLVPSDATWQVTFDPRLSRGLVMRDDGFKQYHTLASTPALALCAAALRARAASVQS